MPRTSLKSKETRLDEINKKIVFHKDQLKKLEEKIEKIENEESLNALMKSAKDKLGKMSEKELQEFLEKH